MNWEPRSLGRRRLRRLGTLTNCLGNILTKLLGKWGCSLGNLVGLPSPILPRATSSRKLPKETWLSTFEEFANPYHPKTTCLRKLPKDYALQEILSIFKLCLQLCVQLVSKSTNFAIVIVVVLHVPKS
jgi:hypothetical protein